MWVNRKSFKILILGVVLFSNMGCHLPREPLTSVAKEAIVFMKALFSIEKPGQENCLPPQAIKKVLEYYSVEMESAERIKEICLEEMGPDDIRFRWILTKGGPVEVFLPPDFFGSDWVDALSLGNQGAIRLHVNDSLIQLGFKGVALYLDGQNFGYENLPRWIRYFSLRGIRTDNLGNFEVGLSGSRLRVPIKLGGSFGQDDEPSYYLKIFGFKIKVSKRQGLLSEILR